MYDCKHIYSYLFVLSSSHPSPPHRPPLTSSYHSQSNAIMLLLQRLHSSLPSTPSPSIPSPLIPHTATQVSSTKSSPHDILPPPFIPERVQWRGRRRGGCWGKGLGKSHWLAPFLLGSVGEEPPAERYEYRGTGS